MSINSVADMETELAEACTQGALSMSQLINAVPATCKESRSYYKTKCAEQHSATLCDSWFFEALGNLCKQDPNNDSCELMPKTTILKTTKTTITTTTTLAPTTEKTSLTPLIAGIIGSITVLCIIAVVVILTCRKKKNSTASESIESGKKTKTAGTTSRTTTGKNY